MMFIQEKRSKKGTAIIRCVVDTKMGMVLTRGGHATIVKIQGVSRIPALVLKYVRVPAPYIFMGTVMHAKQMKQQMGQLQETTAPLNFIATLKPHYNACSVIFYCWRETCIEKICHAIYFPMHVFPTLVLMFQCTFS